MISPSLGLEATDLSREPLTRICQSSGSSRIQQLHGVKGVTDHFGDRAPRAM